MKNIITIFAILFFAPSFVFADTPVSGTLASNTTWTAGNSPYVIGYVVIPTGVTLTIEEGTIVKFSGTYSTLEVNGHLVVNGTETNPAYFTSLNDNSIGGSTGNGTPLSTDWGNIMVKEGGIAEINHSVIRYGGYTGWQTSTASSNLYNRGGNLTVSNSIISDSYAGITHISGTTTLNQNTITKNGQGITASGTGSLILTKNTFTDNAQTSVSINLSQGISFTHSENTSTGGLQSGFYIFGTLVSDYIFEKDTMPYIIGYLEIPVERSVTAHSGSVFKFASIGSNVHVSGKLKVEGTEAEPIYFTSIKDDTILGNTDSTSDGPAINDWAEILVQGEGEATFDHSIVRYGGQYSWGVWTQYSNISNNGGTLKITNSDISRSTYGVHHLSGITTVASSTLSENNTGLWAEGPGSLSFTNDTFINNTSSGTYINLSGGLTFSNSNNKVLGVGTQHGIAIFGTVATDQTLAKDSVPYLVSYLSVPAEKTLTVSPGTVIKMTSIGSQISVAGTLIAIGTQIEPIYITSIKDDTISGDTNSDGGATEASPTDWAEIAITNGGVANIQHSVIRYGGQYSWGVWTNSSEFANRGGILDIQNSEISYGNIGVYHQSGTTTISQSAIVHNGSEGVHNVDSTKNVNARNNFWGSSAGPNYPGSGVGAILNDKISAYVDYLPWLDYDPTKTAPPCVTNCYSNVMFLPGIMGSDLYDLSGNKKWLSSNDTEADYLQMNAGGGSVHGDITTKGAIEEGGLAQGTVNIYKSFIAEMRDWETTYGITATTTPYDWRLDYDTVVSNGRKLSNGNISYLVPPATGEDPYIIATLKKLASTSKTGKVTIIAHSQGGLITKALTAKLGNTEASKYIDKIIFVATPQLGTPEAMARILHGYKAGIPNAISDQKIRGLAQNMQSAYNLLPSDKYFTYVDDSIATLSTTTPSSWQTAYGNTIHWDQGMYNFMSDSANVRIKPLYADLANPEIASAAMLSRAKAVHDEMDNWIPPVGVSFTTVSGWGNETLAWIEYYGKKDCTFVGFNDMTKKVTVVCTDSPHVTIKPNKVIDGDGTVVDPSAQFANGQPSTRYWVNLDKYNPIYVPEQLKTGHADILEISELRTLLTNILTNGITPFPDKYISTIAPSYHGETPRLHFILHSPLTLSFVDSQGNITGLSSAGTVKYDIPGVEYERYGETQWLSVPKEIAGTLKMRGIANGSFDLQIEEVNGNDTISKTSFETIPSGTSTIVTVNILPTQSATASSTLSVDFDGNGSEDLALIAKSNSVVLFDQTPPEAKVSVDLVTRDLKIDGVDENPTTITKNGNNYVVTDSFGNATTLFFQKTYSGKILTYAKLTAIQYGNNPKISVPSSSFLYIWLLNNPVSQTIVVNDMYAIEAVYDKAKNQTIVYLKKKGVQIQKQTFSGLRIVKLVMNKGAVGYEI